MTLLTEQQMAELGDIVNSGQNGARVSYYTKLSEFGVQYGELALGVVLEDQVSGRIANKYFMLIADQEGKVVTNAQWAEIGNSLMHSDYESRLSNSVQLNGTTYYQEINYESIKNYHQQVFDTLGGTVAPGEGVSIKAWTAYMPVETLGTAAWDLMLASSDPFVQIGVGVGTSVGMAGAWFLSGFDEDVGAWISNITEAMDAVIERGSPLYFADQVENAYLVLGRHDDDVLVADPAEANAGVVMILGLGGNDLITAPGQEDYVDAGSGDDIIVVKGGGGDQIYGGAGYDTILLNEEGQVNFLMQENKITAIQGTDFSLDTPHDTFYGVEKIQGTLNDEFFVIDSQSVQNFNGLEIDGGGSNDIIIIRNSNSINIDVYCENFFVDRNTNSRIYVNNISNYAILAPGSVNFYGSSENESVISVASGEFSMGPGDDSVTASGQEGSAFYGEEGNDTILGGAPTDRLYGGAGNDVIIGGGTIILGGTIGENSDTDSQDYYYFFGEIGNDTITTNGFHDYEIINGEYRIFYKCFDKIYLSRDIASSMDDVDAAASEVDGGVLLSFSSGSILLSMADIYQFKEKWESVFSFIGNSGSKFGTSQSEIMHADASGGSLFGVDGDDELVGSGFDDILAGGAGADTLLGGNGFDFASYEDASSGVQVDLATNDTGQEPSDATGDILNSIEGLIGSDFTDVLAGNDLDNVIIARGGEDTMFGRGGNDRLEGGDDDNALHGDDGDDVLIGGGGRDSLNGGNGNDTADFGYSESNWAFNLAAGSASSTESVETLTSIENIAGGSGNDTFIGDLGDNRFDGGNGDDILYGGDGADILIGGLGSDSLDGGGGRDTADFRSSTSNWRLDLANGTATSGGEVDALASIEILLAGPGDDSLFGDAGDNTLAGGDGDDLLIGGAGADTLIGGMLGSDSGIDTVSYAASAGVDVSLDGTIANTGDAVGDTFDGIENLIGSTANSNHLRGNAVANVITGGAGRDRLDGQGGNDSLHGLDGDDKLFGNGDRDKLYGDDGDDKVSGGSDNDQIEGGKGTDEMTGGTGTDEFRFVDANFGHDTITDWAVGERFRIRVYDDTTGRMRVAKFSDFTITGDGTDTVLMIQNDEPNNIIEVHAVIGVIDVMSEFIIV